MNFKIWTESEETKIATPQPISARSLVEAISRVEERLDGRGRVLPRRHEVEVQPGAWMNIEAVVEFALNCDTASVYRRLVGRLCRGQWRPHEGERPLIEKLLHRQGLRLGGPGP